MNNNLNQTGARVNTRIREFDPAIIDFQLAKAVKAGEVKVVKLPENGRRNADLKANLLNNYSKYPELNAGLEVLNISIMQEIQNRIQACLDQLEDSQNVIPMHVSPGQKLALRLQKEARKQQTDLDSAKAELLKIQFYFQLLLSKFSGN